MIIAFELIKRLDPYLFLAAVCAGLVAYGWKLRDNDFQEYITQQKIESQRLVDQAEVRNEQYKKSMAEAARIISGTYANNVSTISVLNGSNNTLLAERLREHDIQRNAASDSKTPASGGDEEFTRTWKIPEKTARSIIGDYAEADSVTEIARACQGYVDSIPNEFFEEE